MLIFRVVPTLVLLAAVGCGYGSTRRGEWEPRATEEPTEAAIQTGGELTDIGEGEGVGAFVEYEAGGIWSVTLACDTLFSGIACEWDVFATPASDEDGELTVWTKELDRGDIAHDNDLGGVTIQTVTAYELDFVSLTADPGATIELEVRLDAYYLDRDPAPERFVYWVGDNGVLHSGAPSNPIKLRPSVP
jgi:hypothetical protein